MSPSPGPSSGKLAGFILLGLAAIALVLGLVTALGGESQDQAGGPVNGAGQSSPTGPGGGQGTSQPGPSGPGQGQQPGGGNGQNGNGQGGNGQNGQGQPPTSYPRGSTTKVIPPPPPEAEERGNGAGAGGAAQGVTAAKVAPVRVYNNSTISGLAHNAAEDFRSAGFNVVTVGNYSQGTIPTSTVYYRPGTGEQATATALANQFGMRVEQRFAGIQSSSPGVIVIVTNNYSH